MYDDSQSRNPILLHFLIHDTFSLIFCQYKSDDLGPVFEGIKICVSFHEYYHWIGTLSSPKHNPILRTHKEDKDHRFFINEPLK
jgi:hypothetical protein